MPLTPQITLTANLETILAGTAVAGYLQITLCGFGPVVPVVPGVAMLADAGIPQLVGPQTTAPLSQKLWGNDVISPAGTFYSISVLDENQNVVQTGMYSFAGTAAIDLSSAAQIVTPQPPQIFALVMKLLTGATPGTVFALPTPSQGVPLLVLYNGVALRPPTDANPDYSFAGVTVTTNFQVDAEEELYALYIEALA